MPYFNSENDMFSNTSQEGLERSVAFAFQTVGANETSVQRLVDVVAKAIFEFHTTPTIAL